jgi:hypothetical protein
MGQGGRIDGVEGARSARRIEGWMVEKGREVGGNDVTG